MSFTGNLTNIPQVGWDALPLDQKLQGYGNVSRNPLQALQGPTGVLPRTGPLANRMASPQGLSMAMRRAGAMPVASGGSDAARMITRPSQFTLRPSAMVGSYTGPPPSTGVPLQYGRNLGPIQGPQLGQTMTPQQLLGRGNAVPNLTGARVGPAPQLALPPGRPAIPMGPATAPSAPVSNVSAGAVRSPFPARMSATPSLGNQFPTIQNLRSGGLGNSRVVNALRNPGFMTRGIAGVGGLYLGGQLRDAGQASLGAGATGAGIASMIPGVALKGAGAIGTGLMAGDFLSKQINDGQGLESLPVVGGLFGGVQKETSTQVGKGTQAELAGIWDRGGYSDIFSEEEKQDIRDVLDDAVAGGTSEQELLQQAPAMFEAMAQEKEAGAVAQQQQDQQLARQIEMQRFFSDIGAGMLTSAENNLALTMESNEQFGLPPHLAQQRTLLAQRQVERARGIGNAYMMQAQMGQIFPNEQQQQIESLAAQIVQQSQAQLLSQQMGGGVPAGIDLASLQGQL